MTRELTGHVVNEANDKLKITALDEPGSGGANHLYEIRGFDTGSNPSDVWKARYGKPSDHSTLLFQNGPIAEVGVNGITHEVLLEILIDRLEAFQRGPFESSHNNRAVDYLRRAKSELAARTRARMTRGIEGTHQV